MKKTLYLTGVLSGTLQAWWRTPGSQHAAGGMSSRPSLCAGLYNETCLGKAEAERFMNPKGPTLAT